MTSTIRLTTPEIQQLRSVAEQIARRHSSAPRFAIEIAERYSLSTGDAGMNISAITSDPDWQDTDLNQAFPWKRIRERHRLAEGKALFDFHIFELRGIGETGDLVCNVQAELDAQGLLAIHADSKKHVWRRPD